MKKSKTVKKLVNQTEFAVQVGVTRRAVGYAIQKGKITIEVIDNRKMINLKKGLKEWDENIDKVASAKGKKKKTKKKIKEKKTLVIDEPKNYMGNTAADSERQDKFYKANLAKLKFEQQADLLVEKSIVKKEAFEIARKLRDALMSIPARVAHEYAVETDPHKLELLLKKELIDILEKFINPESENE